jgi:DMSO/TMAO reductase YedYZ molybdopterin-dependent catalytic subunit
VLLSTLLKECGLKGSATWFVAEGAEEVKGASSMPIAKAMDDCIIAYGMNGEAVRPQNGFPLRLMAPGFEGIFHTKFLRRIKIVDRYYMNYSDYGHLDRDPIDAALGFQIGPKSVITYPSGGQQLPGRGFYEISGLAWSGGAPFVPLRYPPMAGGCGTLPRSRGLHNAWRTPGSAMGGIGMETRPKFFRAAPTRSGRCNRRESRSPSTGTCLLIEITECLG